VLSSIGTNPLLAVQVQAPYNKASVQCATPMRPLKEPSSHAEARGAVAPKGCDNTGPMSCSYPSHPNPPTSHSDSPSSTHITCFRHHPQSRVRVQRLGVGHWPPAHHCPGHAWRGSVRTPLQQSGARRCTSSCSGAGHVLDCGALEELLLFCSRQLGKMFTWHLHFDLAHDLYLTRILSDALDLHDCLRHSPQVHSRSQ
jgi:hypothetical protein